MKKIIAILLFLAATSFAQSLLSVRYPAGTSYPLTTTAARMGGAGAGLSEPYMLTSLNPGNLGTIRQSVYTLSINSDRRYIHEGDESITLGSFSPSFIGFAFPMGNAGTLAANFRQSGSNRFSFQSDTTLINTTPGFVDTIRATQKFDNHVGLSAWEFGWGMELFRRLSLGLTYQAGQYKNHFVESTVLRRTDVSAGLDSIYYNQTNSAISGGFLLRFTNLGVGVSATYPFIGNLNAQQTVRGLRPDIRDNFSTTRDSIRFNDKYKLQLPPSGIIGTSWTFNRRLRTALDVSMVFWDSYYWTDAPNLTFEDGELQNALGISTGIEFVPQPSLLSARYFQTVNYSGGLAFRQLPIDGDWEGSVSVGMGLPLGDMGIVDISVETGIRRSRTESDIKENYVRLNFGMSGGRAWRQARTQF